MRHWVYSTVYVIETMDVNGDWSERDVCFNEEFAEEQGIEFVNTLEDTYAYRVIPVAIKYLGGGNGD